MNAESHAVSGLLSLSQTGCITPPPSPRKEVDEWGTPPKIPFKLIGVKRATPDSITVAYTNEFGDNVSVPLHRGESPSLFLKRRKEAAHALLCSKRRVCAFCTWTNTLISIVVDTNWEVVASSSKQVRYAYRSIQLVRTKYTCNQVHKSQCGHCQQPTWRSSCLTPQYIFHLMPQLYNSSAECHADLSNLKPRSINRTDSFWRSHVPGLGIRKF
jgi:hypothetical protein